MCSTDIEYAGMISDIQTHGDVINSRIGQTRSLCDLRDVIFCGTPLVTARTVAWKKALLEMEWILSGNKKCPPILAETWWKDQLHESGFYVAGYGDQLRSYSGHFDQIDFLIDGIRNHGTSRRLVITTWNPCEMHEITSINGNPRTPTTCHGTVIQLFVRRDKLSMTMYQRSADMLLGVPHNWIQYWALLLWLASRSGLKPGSFRWIAGDAHIYQHESHVQAVNDIVFGVIGNLCNYNKYSNHEDSPQLKYIGCADKPFIAEDFIMTGTVIGPVTKARPKLMVEPA